MRIIAGTRREFNYVLKTYMILKVLELFDYSFYLKQNQDSNLKIAVTFRSIIQTNIQIFQIH